VTSPSDRAPEVAEFARPCLSEVFVSEIDLWSKVRVRLDIVADHRHRMRLQATVD
jgi:hypothetical protein